MAYPVGTRIKLIQEDGLFNVGVVLEHVAVDPYNISGRRGQCTEGWKVVHQPEEGIGWALNLPMLEQARVPELGADYVEYLFKYPVEEEREGVAFELDDSLYAGDKVYIRPDSVYYGLNTMNPKGVEGVIVEYHDPINNENCIVVRFSERVTNSYRKHDLELSSIREARLKETEVMKEFSLRGRIKQTIKDMQAQDFNGHTRYSIISASPLWHQGVEHGACHAAVNRSEVPKRFCIVSSINARKIKERGCKHENIVMYYDWLFNRSPLRSAYLTKKADKALTKGYVITSCKPAANLMQSANVALRQPWEQHSVVVDLFAGMVKEGVNENLAFVLSHYITSDRSNLQILTHPGGMHRVFDWAMASNESVALWLDDKLRNMTESYRTNNNFGGGDNLIAMKAKEKSFDGAGLLRSFPSPTTKQKKTAHVFAAAKSSGSVNAVSLDVRVEWFGSIHKEFYEKVTA